MCAPFRMRAAPAVWAALRRYAGWPGLQHKKTGGVQKARHTLILPEDACKYMRGSSGMSRYLEQANSSGYQ